MKRLVVLISGSGSNLQALIDAIDSNSLPAEIVLVVSNRSGALGLERARRAGIATQTLELKSYLTGGRTRADFDREVADRVAAVLPDLVVLAGWMHVLGGEFLERIDVPVINLHPALPGMFPGTHAIDRALAAAQRGGLDHTGVMVHAVIAEVDAGPVYGSTIVPIQAGDDIDSLSARIHKAEHTLLLDTVRKFLV